MSSARIQGWCPGALRPMLAEDGWVVRIRPPLGRLTPAQARGLAALASSHAQDTVEITSRANLQLRGITDVDYPVLLSGLQALGLVDTDVRAESRRNLLLAPFWQAGDGTTEVASALALALNAPQAPDLPAKFGFALDFGDTPVLRTNSADIRMERCDAGFLVYADGSAIGARAHRDDVVAVAMALAQWFIEAGGLATPRKRMASLVASQPLPRRFTTTPVPAAAQHQPPLGRVPQGYLAALEFGQLPATTLAALAELAHLRLTPWRSVLLEGMEAIPALPDLITRADDPRLRIHACTGAPGCGQAAGATRPLARALAASLPVGQTLHVSGCTKGCAHPAAALTVVATANAYHLIHHGSAAAPPDGVGLTPAELATQIQQRLHATPL
ncbi:precorrin-3B synthase [Rhodoferax saidenbachensis]|uniref:Precorrin-3B synthase n=1 Tax=Rhodoferax saidenbachensis TaxID=1484693 RepID=A0ABU1ZHP7_9BURK|nr:precorrin-3B synthase [Rhodoferax saidenbachensis]MDR7305055.1 precorrin-3B synthase [Rhodoferax saidenbachensis]